MTVTSYSDCWVRTCCSSS